MITSLTLPVTWRDWWGMYRPAAVAQFGQLAQSGCHRPRYALLPADQTIAIVPPGKRIEYGFRLKPGSVIWGFYAASQSFLVQLTDVQFNHRFFQEPFDLTLLAPPAPPTDPALSWMPLPCPHPVTGDGLFVFEAWNTSGGASRVSLVLGVAEVDECPRQ